MLRRIRAWSGIWKHVGDPSAQAPCMCRLCCRRPGAYPAASGSVGHPGRRRSRQALRSAGMCQPTHISLPLVSACSRQCTESCHPIPRVSIHSFLCCRSLWNPAEPCQLHAADRTAPPLFSAAGNTCQATSQARTAERGHACTVCTACLRHLASISQLAIPDQGVATPYSPFLQHHSQPMPFIPALHAAQPMASMWTAWRTSCSAQAWTAPAAPASPPPAALWPPPTAGQLPPPASWPPTGLPPAAARLMRMAPHMLAGGYTRVHQRH